MGAENISVECLSSYLRTNGVRTALAFDRALFDDKQYFPMPFFARIFSDRNRIIKAIVDYKPDLVAFSCMLDNYRWCLDIAREVKKQLDVPVVFGGAHPTSVPELVISNDCVDFVILSEGEYATLELALALERGDTDFPIRNIWWKKNGQIVKNELRPLMTNNEMDAMPMPDKTLFEGIVPIGEYYLTVSLKGCICTCAYCMQNFFKEFERGFDPQKPFIREKSPSRLLEELVEMKRRYSVEYIDIKNNILSGSRKWTKEFLERYPKEVGLPFRIMGHPKLMTDEYCRNLKKAGCHHIQLGIESMNSNVRKMLHRPETNEEIEAAIHNMEKHRLRYSADIIVGLPGEKPEDITDALKLLAGKKGLVRASIFWLCYLPKVDITKYAKNKGYINDEDIERIETGNQENYLSTGSVLEEERQKILKNFQILFRLLPIIPGKWIHWLLETGNYRHIHRLPGFILTFLIIFIDVLVSIICRDKYAIFMLKWVFKEMAKRAVGMAKVFNESTLPASPEITLSRIDGHPGTETHFTPADDAISETTAYRSRLTKWKNPFQIRALLHTWKHSKILFSRPNALFRAVKNMVMSIVFRQNRMRVAEFVINHECDSRCVYCYATKYVDRNKSPMTPEEIGDIWRQCEEAGGIVSVVEGGEPTLHPQLDQIIAALNPWKNIVCIVSNCLTLNRARLQHFKNIGVSIMHFSLDGTSPEENDAVRGTPGHFNKVMKAVEICKEIGLPAYFSTVLTHNNWDRFERVIKLAESMDIGVSGALFVAEGRSKDLMDERLTDKDREKLLKFIEKYSHVLRFDWNTNFSGNYACPAGREKVSISLYGEVMACVCNHLSFGNLRKESLKAVLKRMGNFSYFKERNPQCLVGFRTPYRDKYFDTLEDSKFLPISIFNHPVNPVELNNEGNIRE